MLVLKPVTMESMSRPRKYTSEYLWKARMPDMTRAGSSMLSGGSSESKNVLNASGASRSVSSSPVAERHARPQVAVARSEPRPARPAHDRPARAGRPRSRSAHRIQDGLAGRHGYREGRPVGERRGDAAEVALSGPVIGTVVLVGPVGLEPTRDGLKVRCSATELRARSHLTPRPGRLSTPRRVPPRCPRSRAGARTLCGLASRPRGGA